METQIARWSYLAGLACTAVAVLWRVATGFGMAEPLTVGSASIWSSTFYKAALILLVLSVASASNTKR